MWLLFGGLAFVRVGLGEPAAVELPSELAGLVQRYAQKRAVVIERSGPTVTVLSGGELLATVQDVSTNRLTEIAIMAHRIAGRSQPLARVGLRSLTLSRPEQELRIGPVK